MADLNKVLKGLECCDKKYPRNAWCKYCSYEPDCYHDSICDLLVHDALNLLKSQQAEIERLEKENETLKLAVQSMPNWLDDKRPEVTRCKDCKYWDKSDFGWFCPYHHDAKPDWYCADGIRKEKQNG